MAKRNKKSDEIQELSFEESIEENGLTDAVIGGDIVASFNFAEPVSIAEDKSNVEKAIPIQGIGPSEKNSLTPLIDNRKAKTLANDITPSVEGEPLDIQRCYKIRRSTARMLNEIKAVHPDVNVYMNTIVNAALRHYYDYIFKENGELH